MRIAPIIAKIFFLSIFFVPSGCEPEPVADPCQRTQWTQFREYEIKLAVHISSSNPSLSGGSPGSQNPVDFDKLQVNGTIEKLECNDSTSGPVNLGNTYLIKGVDYTAPIYVPDSYWIGHVVYVYDFNNDKDHLNFNLTIKITMPDGKSYVCNFSEKTFYQHIVQVPSEMYYYILLDVYSNSWVKV